MATDMEEKPSASQLKVMTTIIHGIGSVYSDNDLCDLEVKIGDKSFQCHRLVLAAVSGFFRGMVSSEWSEKKSGEVKIEHDDVTPDSFQMLLDILYKTQEVITKDTATDLLRTAIYLQVQFLEEQCQAFLIDNLSADVCVGTWMFAERYQLPELSGVASSMASDQIEQVIESDEILQLPKAMLLIILGSQTKLSMDNLCRTILRWVEHDPDGRQLFFSELLPFVSFPQLSPVYISELMNYYFDHPFRKDLSRRIQEAVTFNLQGQKPEVKRQILAQQDRISPSPSIHKCAVVVGGSLADDKVTEEVWALRVDGTHAKAYSLKPVPESCGLHFASCTWRNELYVSGGSKEPTYFAKYKAGSDDWEVLADMKRGVERHAMAAAGGALHVLGGLSVLRKRPTSDIFCYSAEDKAWTKHSAQLPLAVQDAAAAVLGHRIYVFGGRGEAGKKPVDLVQCLDTQTGCAYVAGSLPAPYSHVQALSDGGTIYVLCDGNRVFKMRENFEIAERLERLAIQPAQKEKTLVAKVKEHAAAKETKDKANPDSVSFAELGTFPDDVHMLSAYLHAGEMVVCESLSQDGKPVKRTLAMSLTTGKVVSKNLVLPKRLKRFKLQTINVPNEYLDEGKAVSMFTAGDQVRIREGGNRPHGNIQYTSIGSIQGAVQPNNTVQVNFPQIGTYNVSVNDLVFN